MADAETPVPATPDDRMTDPVLRLEGVTKAFGTEVAVRDVTLDVADGELLTLLGPSGCGKTTTLRLLAGLERPSEGTIEIDGTVVATPTSVVPPEERSIGMVFQDFALFPHLTVAENVAFGLTDADESTKATRVDDLLELVGLEGMGQRTPDQLSGGQRQRVALARSLAPEPEILLLDEPFSNLDVRLRVEMREEVRRILKEAGVTAISVTHDQEEALTISDRVGVMHDGELSQVGDPGSVFQHPESRFVASFLGQAGFVSGTVGDSFVNTLIGGIDRTLLEGLDDAYVGADVDVLVRPDDLRVSPPRGEGVGEIVRRQYTGPSFIYHVELDNGDDVRCLHNHDDVFEVGSRVDVDLVADHDLAWYPADDPSGPITTAPPDNA
ncbi:MAG: ABC transporter ATP-binding protein [Halanaeroarchaeum sp.]